MYWSVEPPLAERMELAIANLTSILAEINRDRKQRTEPFTARDFLPQWLKSPEPEREEDALAPEHVMAVMERLMARQEQRVKAGLQ